MKLRDTAVRLRAELADGYGGQDSYDWDAAARTTLRVAVQPVGTAEYDDQRQTTVTRWNLFAGPDEDILATDRFEWAGRTLEVDGDVEEWRRGTRVKYLKAVLKLTSDNQVPA